MSLNPLPVVRAVPRMRPPSANGQVKQSRAHQTACNVLPDMGQGSDQGPH